MLIESGKVLVKKGGDRGENDTDFPQPRTAVGLDKRNSKLIIVVIDGRQPGYSEGATLEELAQLMINLGAYTAMNLDGGGSSTMVMEDENQNPKVLNSPINNQIPGRERVVGNHLGIFARPRKND